MERALRARAETWQYNREMEKAAALDAAGGTLSNSVRLALGYYRDGKNAAQAAGRDVSGSGDIGDSLAAAYRSLSN
ncbi:hypothetical protein [Streptomyces coelicoflavus]|uniref:hypothetical protein n=1 Tax=Streptomyces coelicoflavus TaxID=285562 RepID=UPI002E253059